jgi:hypothetical protein
MARLILLDSGPFGGIKGTGVVFGAKRLPSPLIPRVPFDPASPLIPSFFGLTVRAAPGCLRLFNSGHRLPAEQRNHRL